VRDDDHRDAVAGEVGDDLQHLADHLGVERGGRLIEEQHIGLHRQRPHDGDTLLLDAKNCVVYGGKKLIAAVGVENLVIVEGRDSILVCPVDQAQRVKEVVETLEKEGRTERL